LSLAFSHVFHIFLLWADTLRNCPRGARRPRAPPHSLHNRSPAVAPRGQGRAQRAPSIREGFP
jgi:hypothetical protein